MHDGTPDDPPQPRPLDYRSSRDDRPERNARIAIAVGSGLFAAITVWGIVFFWFINNLYLGMPLRPGDPSPVLNWEFPGLLTLVGIVFWTWLLVSRRKSRPVFLGALIGFGVAVLVEGVCCFIPK
jgi:hypothetical protein